MPSLSHYKSQVKRERLAYPKRKLRTELVLAHQSSPSHLTDGRKSCHNRTTPNYENHLLMMDMSKAFDRVERNLVIKDLEDLETDELHLVKILM